MSKTEQICVIVCGIPSLISFRCVFVAVVTDGDVGLLITCSAFALLAWSVQRVTFLFFSHRSAFELFSSSTWNFVSDINADGRTDEYQPDRRKDFEAINQRNNKNQTTMCAKKDDDEEELKNAEQRQHQTFCGWLDGIHRYYSQLNYNFFKNHGKSI